MSGDPWCVKGAMPQYTHSMRQIGSGSEHEASHF